MPDGPRTLVVPDGTSIIKEMQYKERDFKRIFIPKSVKTISRLAFYGCENLIEVVFEEGAR